MIGESWEAAVWNRHLALLYMRIGESEWNKKQNE